MLGDGNDGNILISQFQVRINKKKKIFEEWETSAAECYEKVIESGAAYPVKVTISCGGEAAAVVNVEFMV